MPETPPPHTQGLKRFEDRVQHVGLEDIALLDMMVTQGPSVLDAVATFEPTVLRYASLNAPDIQQWNDSLVFVFVNNTPWDTHPYCLVNASWVDEKQGEVGRAFLDFLRSNTSYQLMLSYGLR